jgi:hypothetical protein
MSQIIHFFTRKAVNNTNQKGARREKPHRPEPEEQEGMPQHQHKSFSSLFRRGWVL